MREYNPNWRQEYIELKGWENMSSGQKYLATHPTSSSTMGMGNAAMMDELERLKAEGSQDAGQYQSINKHS